MYGMAANHAMISQAIDTIARPSTRRMRFNRLLGGTAAGAPHQVARADVTTATAKPNRVAVLPVNQRDRERGQEHQAEHAHDKPDDVND